MTALALAFVLIAAFLHASWNLLAKRVAGGLAFIWLVAAVASVVYLPLSVGWILWLRPPLDSVSLLFILGSAILHLGYFFLLQRGYQVGDLSLVYPLARSTGPALSTLGAVCLLGERPTALAIGGIVFILFGVAVLTGGPRHIRGDTRGAVLYGILTGSFIACYTLWDAWAVQRHQVPPLILDWGSNVGRALLLIPLVRYRRQEISRHWRLHRRPIVTIAVIATASYILVLTAMTFTPVSYVAPTREISILIGALMGRHLLDEAAGARRIVGAAIMVAGVVALALG